MQEQKINILSNEVLNNSDAICFTSNGVIKKNNELVMGAGVAKAFRDKYPGIARSAGDKVKEEGNKCQIVDFIQVHHFDEKVYDEFSAKHLYLLPVVAFPTKNHWKHQSTLKLILRSAEQLMELVEKWNWERVYLPRPGCSNGGLNWKHQVKPMLEEILDDRVIICYR